MTQPPISIVIVTYNTKELIQRCIDHLQRYFSEMLPEIIVIDNGSVDETFSLLKEKYPNIKSIRSEINVGFGAANNLGIPLAQGKYVLLLNSDAFPHPGALQKAIELMDNHSDVGLAGAQLLFEDGSLQLSAREFPTLSHDVMTFTGFKSGEVLERPSSAVDWVTGAFCIIRPEVIKKIGLLDERFYMYFEEVDYCLRVQQAGYKVWFWPEIVVTHLCGVTCKTTVKTQKIESGIVTLWNSRSKYLYYRKHFGLASTYMIKYLETYWYKLRGLKNTLQHGKEHPKVNASEQSVQILNQAWKDTQGGIYSPPKPW
jgi:GT2 family glycosyltransferase